jgi:hypothetical protein
LRNFSYALLKLLDRTPKTDPLVLPNKDKTLRDRFINGIEDHRLYIALSDKVERDPTMTFKNFRDYALNIEL